MPSGQALATGMRDGTILIWDLSPKVWTSMGDATSHAAKDFEGLWVDLADPDAGKAYRSLYALSATPARALPFLASRLLQPVPEPDRKRARQLIADLDNNRYAVREAATIELARLGQLAESEMRQALNRKPTAEMRVRLEALLKPLRGLPPRETMRAIRAIQVLEWIGSPDAGQILEQLAHGRPEARRTQEAKATLERLANRTRPSP
jgi:hypothetical protein